MTVLGATSSMQAPAPLCPAPKNKRKPKDKSPRPIVIHEEVPKSVQKAQRRDAGVNPSALPTQWEYPILPHAIEATIQKRHLYDFAATTFTPYSVSTWRISDGALVECDEEFLLWAELPLAALKTVTWSTFFPKVPVARPEVSQLLASSFSTCELASTALISEEADYVSLCTAIVSGTGRLKYCLARVFALCDKSRTPVETCCITTELTEEQAQVELARGGLKVCSDDYTK